MQKKIVYIISVVNLLLSVKGDVPTVNTTLGLIRGVPASDGDYNMYLGFPYGRVDPSNPFGPASSHPTYDDIYDAVDDSASCPQLGTSSVIGTLDCLQVNVFVPTSVTADEPLPVMAWLYGGRFEVGSFSHTAYNPRFIVRHDVIVVSINYRVGIFGFMCTDHPRVPGNQALRDQWLALEWIRDNIRNFGGDPDRVTLAGNSAGSMSADLLVVKSLDRPKPFHQVILQSGAAFLPSYTNPETNYPITLAQYFGYDVDDISLALDHLATISASDIITAAQQLGTVFRPCIEEQFEDVEGFLTHNWVQSDVLAARDIKAIIGFNSNEGLLNLGSGQGDDIPNIINITVSSIFDIHHEDFKGLSTLQKFFFGDEVTLLPDMNQNLYDLRSDLSFSYPTLQSVNRYLRSEASAVYLYVFSHDGDRNLIKVLLGINGDGASHGDELGYLFDDQALSAPSPEDQLIIDRMTTLWTNFIKHGDPTPAISDLLPVKWEPITSLSSPLYYMNINSSMVLGNRPFRDRTAFWDLFYETNGHLHVLNSLNNNYE